MASKTTKTRKGKSLRTGGVAQRLNALLFAKNLTPRDIETLLSPYGIADAKQADANIQAMAGDPRARTLFAGLLPELLRSIGKSADPDQALTHWERFAASGLSRAQLYEYLAGSPQLLEVLCRVFGNSEALAKTMIRDPLLVYWLGEEQALHREQPKEVLERTLGHNLDTVKSVERKLDALRRFRRRETLRIGIRDLLRQTDVPGTTRALSDLAEVLIQGAYEVAEAKLAAAHGLPMKRGPRGAWGRVGFAVIAMGKLGGGELNYSSDVDLLYVCDSIEGETRGRTGGDAIRSLANEEYFELLAREVTKALTEVTQEGYVFRVDLRLRAEGAVGQLTRSLESYEQYYRSRGQVWERLALLKAWPVAGDLRVGHSFLRQVWSFIFGEKERALDPAELGHVVQEVKVVKDRIDEKMAAKGLEGRHVKLGTGGIREIEFAVQALQVLFGRMIPGVISRNTLQGIARLGQCGLLDGEAEKGLTDAYVFLRDVEHKLQMVQDLQTHSLPDGGEELARCAVRLGYEGTDSKQAVKRFEADYRRHTTCVHDFFQGLFGDPAASAPIQAAFARITR